MKKLIALFALAALCSCSACEDRPLKRPFIIIGMSEGDGCCDISFRDSVGNHGCRCTSYGNFQLYKVGDTLK